MAARLTALKEGTPGERAAAAPSSDRAPAGAATARHGPPAQSRGAQVRPRAIEDLSPALQSMAERLAHDHAKRFRL